MDLGLLLWRGEFHYWNAKIKYDKVYGNRHGKWGTRNATITYLSVLYFKNHIVSYDAKVHQFKIPRVIVYPLYPKNFEGHQFFFYPLAGQSQKQKVKIPRAWTGSHWLLYCTAYFPIIHRNPQLIAMRQPRGRILMHSLDWWYAQQRFIRDTWPQVQDPTAAPNSFKIYWFDLIWLVI